MTLTETAQLLGNFGEFFGAIAVVVTLVFLTFQMRQNAVQTRNSTVQAVMSMEANGRFTMLNSPVPSILVRLRDGETITPEEEQQFASFMHGVFQHYETAFHAYRLGTVPKEVMAAIDERVGPWVEVPGWETRWEYLRGMMTESFRHHIDELTERPG